MSEQNFTAEMPIQANAAPTDDGHLPAKGQPIRILHLEDLPSDAELVAKLLKKQKLNHETLVVNNRADYIKELRAFRPDIIISDHTLPSFNSLEALYIMHQSGKKIPFLLLTGTVSEEFAVRALSEGVDDYILKDRPQRLAAAIQTVMEKKRIQREREKTELRLRKIFDTSVDIICTIDKEGRFTEVSPASETIWGYKPEELRGKNYMDFVLEEDHPKTILAASDILNGEDKTNFENRYIRKDGRIVPIVWSARWDRESNAMYCIARDGSEKLKAEKTISAERKRLTDLFNVAPVSKCILKGENHTFELANPVYMELSGKKDIVGKTVREAFPEVEGQGFFELLDEVYRTGKPFTADEFLVKVDREGKGELTDIYLNFVYQPFRNAEGKVEGIFYFGVDVTEQVKARKLIEDAKKQHEDLLQNLPTAVYSCDAQGNVVLYNKAAELLWGNEPGKSLEELQSTHRILYPDGQSMDYQDLPMVVALRERRVVTDREMIIQRPDGSMSYVLSNPIPTFSSDGALTGAINVLIDITDRKEAEKKLMQSEKRYRALTENISDAILLIDENARRIYQSPSVQRIGGYTLEDTEGKNILDYVHPDDFENCAKFLATVKDAPGISQSTQYRVRHKDGHYIWIEGTITNYLHDEHVKGYIVNYRDISDRKSVEEANQNNFELLQAISARQSSILNALPANIALLDKEGVIVEVNEEWKEFARHNGLNHERYAVGENYLAISENAFGKDAENAKQIAEGIRRVLDGSIEAFSMEYACHSQNEQRWFELKVSPTGEADYIGAVVMHINVTERKMAEQEIHMLNESLDRKVRERTAELEAANRDLESFGYSVSHDLRSPLHVINGYSSILIKRHSQQLNDEAKELLTGVKEYTLKMSLIMENLLNLARLGKTALVRKDVDMNELVGAVLTELKLATESANIKVTLHDLTPARCDSGLIRQVWLNLLSNAIKYSQKTENPCIELGTTCINDENVYYVKDNGAGFDMKYADKLFQVFQRLHHPSDFEGTGVGLNIVHRIVKKHGGKIWAESKVNEGSIFYFTLRTAEHEVRGTPIGFV